MRYGVRVATLVDLYALYDSKDVVGFLKCVAKAF